MKHTAFNAADVTIAQHNSLASAAACVINADGYNGHAEARKTFVKQLYAITDCFVNDTDALYAVIDAYNAHFVQISATISATNAQTLVNADAKAQFVIKSNEKLPQAIAALIKYVEACYKA